MCPSELYEKVFKYSVPKSNKESEYIEYIRILDIPNPYRSEFIGDTGIEGKVKILYENQCCFYYDFWLKWLKDRCNPFYIKKRTSFYGYIPDEMCYIYGP